MWGFYGSLPLILTTESKESKPPEELCRPQELQSPVAPNPALQPHWVLLCSPLLSLTEIPLCTARGGGAGNEGPGVVSIQKRYSESQSRASRWGPVHSWIK